MKSTLRIGIVAGEVSGDLLAVKLMTAIRNLLPNVTFVGITGPQMRAAGCETIATINSLSVMGAIEVIAKLPTILRARRLLLNSFLKNPPDIYIGIDAPDFNIPVELKLRKKGIFTVHYNSPTIWAWRKGRIKTIAKSTNLMLTLFPFEAKFYQQHNLPVAFVGHPLAEDIPLSVDKIQAREMLGIAQSSKVIAILPGSRESEINQLANLFLLTAQRCLYQYPELEYIVPVVDSARREQFETIKQQVAPQLKLKVVLGESHQVIAASDVVLLASGTATLETALFKKPMVVAYRFNPLTAWLAKRIVKVRHFALPNLIAGKTLVPEFFQEEATPQNLANALLYWINHPEAVADLQTEFEKIHQELKQGDSKFAAKVILEEYQRIIS